MIGPDGGFVKEAIEATGIHSFHILNYNSPGATGALPFSAHIVNQLNKQGMFESESSDAQCGPWKFSDIIEKLAL